MGEIKIKSGNLWDGSLISPIGGINFTIEDGYMIPDPTDKDGRPWRYESAQIKMALPKGRYTICVRGVASTSINSGCDVYTESNVGLVKQHNLSGISLWMGNFTLTEDTNIGIMVKIFDGKYHIQLLEGTYTSETIPEYQPYFLNRPAHQFTSGEWIDIPTHHFINGRWQGELTSQSPLKFRADGEMLDWRVEGRKSGNLFDIGTTINDYERAYTIISVDGSSISMKLEASGMTFHYRTHNITTTGTVTIYCKGSKAKPQLLVRLRSMDDTKWLTNSDVTISGMAYNGVYNGWYSYAMSDTFIKTIIIPECLYWNMGVGFNNGETPGEIMTISNPMVISGTYTSSTIPPYEPYGGVGDWDETEQKYKIPVTTRSGNLYSGAWKQGFWAYDTGAGWSTDSKYVRTAKMPCEGNTKYEFVCSLPDGSKDYGFVFWDTNGNYIGNIHSNDVQNTPVKYSITSPANAKTMAVNIARYSDGERHPADILSFDLYELHEVNLYTDHQLMDGDSIDFTTDQTTIPIATGNNTLTVDTAVQPKSVFVKFEG